MVGFIGILAWFFKGPRPSQKTCFFGSGSHLPTFLKAQLISQNNTYIAMMPYIYTHEYAILKHSKTTSRMYVKD